MDKTNGAVKEVIKLASRIATLRAEATRLHEEIAGYERTLEGMLGGRAASRRGSKAPRRPVASNTGVEAKAAKARGKTGKGASKKAKARNGGAPRSGTIMEAIVGALEARRGEAMSVTGVADAVGANPASVATMLKRLVERGRIAKPALGRYQAA